MIAARTARRLMMLERDHDKLAALLARWPCPSAERNLAIASAALATARTLIPLTGEAQGHLDLAASRLTQAWRAVRYVDTATDIRRSA